MTRDETIDTIKQLLSKTRDGKKKTAGKVEQLTKLLDVRYNTGYRDGFNEGRNESYEEIASLRKELEILKKPKE